MAVIGALRELNAAQEAAVAHDRGPLLILAGAGTGKTRVLVERYSRLRQEGVGAQAILLLTFTDKAAREMLDRIERDDELPSAERWVTTYHAFAQQFVQEHGWLCGLPRTFRIASGEMEKRLKDNPQMGAQYLTGFTTARGALPITIGEEVVGAAGVSGAPGGEKDEACVKAALDKVADQLK